MVDDATIRKTAFINGATVEIAYADLSDEQMATAVRMLERMALDHEGICVGGRDRILFLSQELARAKSRIDDLEWQWNEWQVDKSKGWQPGALGSRWLPMVRAPMEFMGEPILIRLQAGPERIVRSARWTGTGWDFGRRGQVKASDQNLLGWLPMPSTEEAA